jgi:hypothetical protein
MTEYDAFGNPVDQPPLDSSSAITPPQPSERQAEPAAPVATPGPTTPSPIATPTPQYTPPAIRVNSGGSGGGKLILLLIILVVIGIPVAGAVFAFNQAGDTIDSVQKSFNSFGNFSSTTSTSSSSDDPSNSGGSAAPPEGLSRHSMLLGRNLRPALREIKRAADGGRPTLLRVEASRVDVQVLRSDGTTSLIHRPWNEKASVLGTSSGSPGATTVPWSRIDTAAPRRLWNSVRNGSDRSVNQMSYAVLLAATGTWSAFRQNGTGFTAGASGRNAHRIG